MPNPTNSVTGSGSLMDQLSS